MKHAVLLSVILLAVYLMFLWAKDSGTPIIPVVKPLVPPIIIAIGVLLLIAVAYYVPSLKIL